MASIATVEDTTSTPSQGMSYLLRVVVPLAARGFLRQVTLLTMANKKLAAAAPHGTSRQIYDAARSGNSDALTTYLVYWRDSSKEERRESWLSRHESRYPFNWMSMDRVACLQAAVSWNRLACVKLLVAAAPAVNINLLGVDGAALHIACDLGFVPIVRLLVAAPSIDLSRTDAFENTPLHCAAKSGHVEIVQILLGSKIRGENGLRLLVQNAKGKTALDLANEGKHQEVSAILVEAVEKKRALDAAGIELFHAAYNGHMGELRRLAEKWEGNEAVLNWGLPYFEQPTTEVEAQLHLEFDQEEGGLMLDMTPILAASYMGHIDALELLSSLPGVNPLHVTGFEDFNILMWAVFNKENRSEACKWVLSNLPSIDINFCQRQEFAHPNDRRTALQLAIQENNIECVRVLLGAPGISLQGLGLTLSQAVSRPQVEIVRMLCAAGINANSRIGYYPKGFRKNVPYMEGTVMDQVATDMETARGEAADELAEMAGLLRAAGGRTTVELKEMGKGGGEL